MFNHTHTRLAAGIFALAFAASASVGCSSNPALTDKNPVITPPDANEALVLSGPRLGASDSLGHQLFVVSDETRFAQAHMVYEMAVAESGTPLHLQTVPFEDHSPTTPRQVIVSGEPIEAGPDAATATGEVLLFE
ncbi:MAG: hypothetical protein WD294_06500 [Phycisphaeraceae bacterium]